MITPINRRTNALAGMVVHASASGLGVRSLTKFRAKFLWVHRQQLVGGKHPSGMQRIEPATPQEADDRQLTRLCAGLTKRCGGW